MSEKHCISTQLRSEITQCLLEKPYDAVLYIARAIWHVHHDYADLAVGDAYKALLLTDEVQDESGEYHDQAAETLDAWLRDGSDAYDVSLFSCEWQAMESDLTGRLGRASDVTEVAALCYRILVISLQTCQCLRSAFDFSSRALRLQVDEEWFRSRLEEIRMTACRTLAGPEDFDKNVHLSDRGALVRREIYPWNNHEPDRYSSQSLSFLNKHLSYAAPKCEVRAIDLPLLNPNAEGDVSGTSTQLGLFARSDFASGEKILEEYSLLTANNRLHDPLCDACSSELSPDQTVACGECDDTLFCSSRCREAALESYHPAICGKDVDAIGKDTNVKDSADSLYFLLLARSFALAETRGVHPLDLPETMYLFGDFNNTSYPALKLPFSFEYSVLHPLHVLEKMDIDIFSSIQRYDFWILNTLYAKFRGVASARVSARDGRPEVCGVHPLWGSRESQLCSKREVGMGRKHQVLCSDSGGEDSLGSRKWQRCARRYSSRRGDS